MIAIQNLKKSFGRLEVLKGINLKLETPGIIAVLGPNGSGKTTLMKSILGMVLPSDGSIEVDGSQIAQQWDYRRQIAYLPQIARFPENLTVRELLAMISDIRGGEARPEPLIEQFGLQPCLDQRLRNLSGGTKQKVNLTLGLMYDTPIIMMDEPTAGLDPVALIQLKSIMQEERARGKMILLTTHIMSLVEEMADEIIFLLEGHIYFRGAIEEILAMQQETSLERAIAALLSKKSNMNSTTVQSQLPCSKYSNTAFSI